MRLGEMPEAHQLGEAVRPATGCLNWFHPGRKTNLMLPGQWDSHFQMLLVNGEGFEQGSWPSVLLIP